MEDLAAIERALDHRHGAIRVRHDEPGLSIEDAVLDLLPWRARDHYRVRPHRQAALDRWLSEERGALVHDPAEAGLDRS